MSTKDQYIRLITFLFFLSGAGALIYQVVWQRVLTQAIGVDHIAIVFIVTIFMMGLGIGSFAGGLVTTLPNRTVMIAYAALEFAVGVFGIFSNDALRWLNDWNARGGTTGITRDFAVNCIFLVGPIILMGMTTPMLIHLLRDRTANFGTTIGRYYGANIVGAAFGALCSLFLIELFGLFDTTLFAVAINFLIGGVFLTLALKPGSVLAADTPGLTDALTPETPEASNDPSEPSRSVAWTYLASFLFGAANLAIQIVVFRLFINYLSPISYIFPIGIASYLFLMALGQSFGGRWVDSVQPSEYPRLLLCILAGTAAMFIVVLNIPYSFLDNLSSPFGKGHYGFMLLTAFPLALVFMSPTFFASAFLPVMAKAVLPDIKSAGRSFGMVLAASTMGNIFGAFFVGVFLFEWIGAIASVFVLIAAIPAFCWYLSVTRKPV